METIQQQIGALQLIVQKQQAGMKRQRFAIIALAGIIVAGGFIAAVSQKKPMIVSGFSNERSLDNMFLITDEGDIWFYKKSWVEDPSHGDVNKDLNFRLGLKWNTRLSYGPLWHKMESPATQPAYTGKKYF